jgi:hypothetical protein
MTSASTTAARATQTAMVYELLKDGPITSAEAYDTIGCVHLPRRIKDLKELGVEIKTEKVDTINRFGKKTHFCRYSLGSAAIKPTTFLKPKRNPFLAGLMYAAKIVLKEPDLVAAKRALKLELLKAAGR